MNFDLVEKIARAVLYEGFLLYPYRKSSVKNRQRWQFGTLGPAGGADPSVMQTQCLLQGDANTRLEISVRFLDGEVERCVASVAPALACDPVTENFSFGTIRGSIEIESERVAEHLYRLTVQIHNLSADPRASMMSTHTLLGVEHGAFVSSIDPPEDFREAAKQCRNIGTWPVLAGLEGERHLMLSSPIILYDYPQIAPESAGDLFDGTEIDEILSLRVLTLTDGEKAEMCESGDRARAILDRTESLPPEAFARMHGAIRGLRNASRLQFREGDRVRLHPRKKADIFDMALDGRIAIVEAVERDFEDRVHLAVTIEDDPGRDFGIARQIGHRFFFGPEEVELV